MTGSMAAVASCRPQRTRFHWTLADGAEVAVEVRWNPRRRTRMGISFASAGMLLVDAPPSASLDEVRSLLRTHARWIRHRRRAAAESGVWYPLDYVDGAVLFHRGRAVSLRLGAGEDTALAEGELLAPRNDTKRRVWAWYAGQAESVLGNVVAAMVAALPWLGTEPPWRHRYMRTQWGSCSTRGRISLNSHLVKLPDRLIEYVVLHELCHLRHLNHGPGFCQLMDAHMADWRRRRRALRHHAGLLREPVPE